MPDISQWDCTFACGNCGKPMHASEGIEDPVRLMIVHAECVTEVEQE